jgi:hypothetical protein
MVTSPVSLEEPYVQTRTAQVLRMKLPLPLELFQRFVKILSDVFDLVIHCHGPTCYDHTRGWTPFES